MSQLLSISFGFGISLSVLLTLFLEFCFRDGNIFELWLPFWARLELRLKRKPIKDEYEWLMDNTWFTKPLGSCVVCMGFWISLFVLAPFIKEPVVYIFGILLSSFLIRLVYNYII